MSLVLFITLLLMENCYVQCPSGGEERIAIRQRLSPGARKALLEARESVWRSFFANDREALERLIPEDTIVMDAGSPELGNRRSVLEGAAQFAKSGARLVRLDFSNTEIQRYGGVAIIYSTYFYELEENRRRTPFSGRVSEIFVLRKGRWVNPGWHMEPVKVSGASQ